MFLCPLLLLASTSYASIPESYGTATHGSSQWQSLYDGENFGADGGYGVSWSINGGEYGNSLFTLNVGDTIQFQIVMYTEDKGNHNLNLSKTWFDFDQDNDFDEEDVISFYAYEVWESKPNPVTPANDNIHIDDFVVSTGEEIGVIETDDSSGLVNSLLSGAVTFKSEVFTITSDLAATNLYLRSRVTCSESLASTNTTYYDEYGHLITSQWDGTSASLTIAEYNDLFQAAGYLGQGEMEEYEFTVNAAPVPEPATMLLFGIGLVGLSGYIRRKKR